MPALISDESLVKASAQAVTAELQGETVILHTTSGQYYGLNEVGSRIWQIIQESVVVRSLIDRLKLEYDVEYFVLKADVVRVLADLAEASLINIQKPHWVETIE